MKNIYKALLVAMLVFSITMIESEVNAQQVNVNLSVFQNSLSPYGRWVNRGNYGQVWVSNTPGFVPYQTGGHWAYTDYGWTWVSDYDWGWAPFHYGRWAYEPGIGWYWVPGYDWAPAWVAWRNNNSYYGWAPLSPGLSISVGTGYGNQIPYDRWVFAPHQYINSPYVSRYYVSRAQNVTIIRNTTVINNVNVRNNVNYVSGPRREDVERINHAKIQTYTVANSARPGRTVINNNTVNVYRPVVNKSQVTINNNNTTVNNKTVNKNSNNASINTNNNNINNKVVNINRRNFRNNNAVTTNQPVVKTQPDNIHQQNNNSNTQAQQNRAQANKNFQNHAQQNHFNNAAKQMNNNRPQMQRQSPQSHPNQDGGGHERKPGK